MSYSYISVDVLKGTGALNVTSTAHDARLRQLAESVSRGIDRYDGRVLHPHTRTLYLDGPGGTTFITPDIIAVTSLKEDSNGDGTFDTTWATADYHLAPYNADPTNDWGGPYRKLLVNAASTGTQEEFLRGQRNYEIVGTFGYISVTEDTGRSLSGSHDATATSLVLSGTPEGAIGIGDVLSIGTASEQLYVTGIGSGAGTTITVERGVNGSTAGSHGSGDTISAYQHPEPIREAALIQCARLWQRRNSGFASEVGFDTGTMMVFRNMDPDVKQMLNPYRRLRV